MKDEFKVYRFYKKTKDIERSVIMDKYPLIAVTNNKQLAKDFEKTRNMDKYVKISDIMSKEAYVAFMNQHTGEEIDEDSNLVSYDSDTGERRDIHLPYTKFEYIVMQDYIESHLQGPDGPNVDVSLLNDDYIKALDKLNYRQIANLNLRLADDFDMPEFEYNELSLFISVFKEYLNI